jgi:regulator of protease activity HflC (stomatin/prohibitin superfamily)
MDTAKLELAAQRYREAEAALDAARADLQAEALTFLRQTEERGAQATVVKVTGWTREYVRRIVRNSEEKTA